MKTPAETAKNTVEIGKKHIATQCQRIERQDALIKRLERDGQNNSFPRAASSRLMRPSPLVHDPANKSMISTHKGGTIWH